MSYLVRKADGVYVAVRLAVGLTARSCARTYRWEEGMTLLRAVLLTAAPEDCVLLVG